MINLTQCPLNCDNDSDQYFYTYRPHCMPRKNNSNLHNFNIIISLRTKKNINNNH